MKNSNKKKTAEMPAETKLPKKSVVELVKDWVASLHLGKPQAVMAAVTFTILVASFLIFNNLTGSKPMHTIPVLRRNDRHIVDCKVLVQPVKGCAGTTSSTDSHGSSWLVLQVCLA